MESSVSNISSERPEISKASLPAKLGTFFDYLFGLLVIVLSLAAISAIPIIHFFSLGYLLEASARVARSGRFRDGLIGLKPASRIGKVIVAGWFIFLPIRLLYSYWVDAEILVPQGEAGRFLGGMLLFLSSICVLGMIWAIMRGGKFRHFLWAAPIRFFRWLGEPKQLPRFSGLSGLQSRFKLFDYFKLGFLGFLGGALWLLIPTSLLFLAPSIPIQPLSLLVSLIGGIILAVVILYLPFVQTRFALSRKFSTFRDWRSVRQGFRRAPLALWVALVITLLFALPLYVLKIELAPQEVAWIPNLVFVAFMFPARLLLGWATSRSMKSEMNRHWIFRILGRIGMLPAAAVYVFVVWISQYLSWHGSYSLLEQHAFLLPAPMLGL
ncbi:MAG: hypothetical protein P1U89_09715 [Verrucomicrobiales bacterium]|nr:hypothetical protein [Verrucomicrobiales bacterium]